MHKFKLCAVFALFALSLSVKAAPLDDVQLAVWANEAIVATYTYDYKNFLQRQKEIAKYFTADGWTAYSAAVTASKLPETIQANSYNVSAVATLPPTINTLGSNQWEAKMPLLVVYKNPQYQQKQTLEVTIRFTQAPGGQGVRGFAITSLQAKVSEPPCQCQPNENSNSSTTNAQ
ncbi:DotI/IcmL family type IV secretion protein [Legionella micdadei]|uniref:DotI/IcmL family type IV secretion protein n=1 Tax=Legionella micdadei TaxID=451 RepID=UPI0009EF796B|nr:DotI/IcmL family type IV secretion protein [Legionella micdadei]ARH01352.1 type IV secretion protein IcmL [Legionella micdadei]